MTIYKFPSDFGRSREPKKEKKMPIHHPEFIDIEDLQNEESIHSEEYEDVYTSIEGLERFNLPFLLRIFTFGVSLAIFVGSFLLACLSVVMGVLTIVTLRQARAIEERFHNYWRYSKRLFATALGLLIMCFSPALGMGFIAIYFALQGESVEDNFINRLFKQHH